MKLTLVTLLAGVLLLAGCSTAFAPFTDDVRSSHDPATLLFHLSANLELKSIKLLEPLDTVGPFKNDGHRYLRIAATDTGRAVAQGDGWLAVDFGRGVLLRFERRGDGSGYVMPGWGTLTVEGERYDIQVGVMSGNEIRLLWEKAGVPGRP